MAKYLKHFVKDKDFSKESATRQVFKPFKKLAKKHYRRIIAPKIGYIQIDLADLKKYKAPVNRNIRYHFFIIDVYSRYLWIIPLTGRENLHKHFIKWYHQNHGKKWIKTITSDQEFLTNKFEDFLDDKQIVMYKLCSR